MSELPSTSLQWLSEHHGVITTTTLRSHEVGEKTLSRLVHRGVLRVEGKGVFAVASAPVTVEQRCAVLCASHPHGFVTGPTAGHLAELRRMPLASELHLAVLHGRHLPPTTGVRWRQTTKVAAADRHDRGDGIIVASWSRLAFDLAADLRELDHLSVVNQLLHQQKVSLEQLLAIERRLGHPGRPGSGRFRRTLSRLGGAACESHPEVALATALRALGVPVEAQTTVVRPSNGRPIRIDLAVPAVRWGVELDIHPEHRSFEGHAADAERRRDMHRLGWQVETVSEHDMRAPERIAGELAALYRIRLREAPPECLLGGVRRGNTRVG